MRLRIAHVSTGYWVEVMRDSGAWDTIGTTHLTRWGALRYARRVRKDGIVPRVTYEEVRDA